MDLESYIEFISRYKNLDEFQQIHIFNSLVKEIPTERIQDVKRIQNFVNRHKRSLLEKINANTNVQATPDPTKFFAIGISKIKTRVRTLLDAAHVVLVDEQLRVVLNHIVRHKTDDIIWTLPDRTGFNNADRWIFQHRGKSRKFIIEEIKKTVGTATLVGFDLKIQAESLYWNEMLRSLCTLDFHNIFVRVSPFNPTKTLPVGARNLFNYYLNYDIYNGPQSAVVAAMLTMKLFSQIYMPMVQGKIGACKWTNDFSFIPRLPKPERKKRVTFNPNIQVRNIPAKQSVGLGNETENRVEEQTNPGTRETTSIVPGYAGIPLQFVYRNN